MAAAAAGNSCLVSTLRSPSTSKFGSDHCSLAVSWLACRMHRRQRLGAESQLQPYEAMSSQKLAQVPSVVSFIPELVSLLQDVDFEVRR
ncbi:hypothetical protein BT67DRAFT_445923 [Trichocladium antarcticum]|uniref:Uncharacterized protein n=1 Tax=Trichocladium antarcticum TaxID=1450529 RepID=A0AAN6UEL6_9PEZI|nr:hypothetical protein BT67DRAFT_445923 [Trichocladium antarcticum]